MITPLCKKTEMDSWENQPFTTIWPQSKNKMKDIVRTIKKKPKRMRTAFTTEQLRVLELTFSQHKYINSERRKELSGTLCIGEKCIKIWFQNRRMKQKKESSESSGDSSGESFADSTSDSPPLSTPSTEQTNLHEPLNPNYEQFNNDNFCHYQLPTYNYNSNAVPQSVHEGMQMNNFYGDNNVYPTEYYPNGDYYFGNVTGNYVYSQINGGNHYWNPTSSSYYSV